MHPDDATVSLAALGLPAGQGHRPYHHSPATSEHKAQQKEGRQHKWP